MLGWGIESQKLNERNDFGPLSRHTAHHIIEQDSQGSLGFLVLTLHWGKLTWAVFGSEGVVYVQHGHELLEEQVREGNVTVVAQQRWDHPRSQDASDEGTTNVTMAKS